LSNPQIAALKSMDPEDYLANLMRQWIAAHFGFRSYCAYEKRPTDGVMLVVSMESAAELCDGSLDAIDADHGNIAKPVDQNSPSYVAFESAYITVQRESLQRAAHNPSFALPDSSLMTNTGTIVDNTMIGNVVINGTPDRLALAGNHGTINSNTMNGNWTYGNVTLLDNSGLILHNEMRGNTAVASNNATVSSGEKSKPPFQILDEGYSAPDRDGIVTCKFRIQLESQSKFNHLTVALKGNGLLGFRTISAQPTVILRPFVGYLITKVINPRGELTVIAAFSKSRCNGEYNISGGF
jgi:hypothetical protein